MGIFILICSVIAMVKAAEMEDRSPLLWGGYTLVLGLAIGPFFGFVVSFLTMFILKMVRT